MMGVVVAGALGASGRGVAAAVRARPKTFVGGVLAIAGLSVFLPPLVLSLARKPVDYFTFNPWLVRLPEYLVSPDVPSAQKLDKLPDLALFWFSADSPFGGTEWGFVIDVGDGLRVALTSLLFGLYFALWAHRRDAARRGGAGARLAGSGGAAGAFMSLFGLSTGPCSVVGCGAPVLPVVGLALAGLSSGTLKFLSAASSLATGAVLVALTLGVAYLGWLVGDGPARGRPPL